MDDRIKELKRKKDEGQLFTYNKIATSFRVEARDLSSNFNLKYIKDLLFVIDHRDYWAGLVLNGINLKLYKIKSYIQLKMLHLLKYMLSK